MPSHLLIAFFEEVFLPVQDLKPVDVKRYRNAIGRASQLLGHPCEYIDAIQPGFRDCFIEDLLRLGFSVKRSKDFADCVGKVAAAIREAKRVVPRPKQKVTTVTTTAAVTYLDLIYDDDDILIGDADQLLRLQAIIDAE